MDNSLNLVCQTFTGYDIPEEVLQNIKKFMIVPRLDNIFNKNYETIWRCIELLQIKYNDKHYNIIESDCRKPFPIYNPWFKKLVQLTDGSGGDSSIKRYSNYHYTSTDIL